VVTFASEKNLGLVAFDERVWRERQRVGCVQGRRHYRPNDSFPWSQSTLMLRVKTVLVAGASVTRVDIPGDQTTIIRLNNNYSSWYFKVTVLKTNTTAGWFQLKWFWLGIRKYFTCCFISLGDSLASEFYVSTFRNTVPSSKVVWTRIVGTRLPNLAVSSQLFFLFTRPMKMKKCSETSPHKIQTLGNHPQERVQHSQRGESLKSRTLRAMCMGAKYRLAP
jgi:hypothetical protein